MKKAKVTLTFDMDFSDEIGNADIINAAMMQLTMGLQTQIENYPIANPNIHVDVMLPSTAESIVVNFKLGEGDGYVMSKSKSNG